MGISYLIDTHILLWWLFDDPKLNAQCRAATSFATLILILLLALFQPGK